LRTVAIIGYGELGCQVERMVVGQARPDQVYFFDDLRHAAKEKNSLPFDAFHEPRFADAEFYVALGYRHLDRKKQIISQLLNYQRNLPNLIHPTCHVSQDVQMGVGCILYPMCNIDMNVIIGNGALIHNSVTVSHHCEIGDAVYISPGVVLCGRVRVEAASFLGAGAVVANGVTIASEARVAIGTVVSKNVPHHVSIIGNPMRVMSRPFSFR